MADAPPRLSIRIDLGPGHRLGPGKVRLRELIAGHGSIAGAGRTLGMSFRRAWRLVETKDRGFGCPVIEAQIGGPAGGGARLWNVGAGVVARHRAVEAAAERAAAPYLSQLGQTGDL